MVRTGIVDPTIHTCMIGSHRAAAKCYYSTRTDCSCRDSNPTPQELPCKDQSQKLKPLVPSYLCYAYNSPYKQLVITCPPELRSSLKLN